MKIALCLTGQPRGIAINTPHLLKFLVEPSNIQDIFVHSWFDKSSVGKALIGNYQNLGVVQAGDDKLILSLCNNEYIFASNLSPIIILRILNLNQLLIHSMKAQLTH